MVATSPGTRLELKVTNPRASENLGAFVAIRACNIDRCTACGGEFYDGMVVVQLLTVQWRPPHGGGAKFLHLGCWDGVVERGYRCEVSMQGGGDASSGAARAGREQARVGGVKAFGSIFPRRTVKSPD